MERNKIFIIAEAGVNHNGDLKIAKRLIDEAKRSGADAVKFQTFKAENLVTRTAPKAVYQKVTTDSRESQFDMIRRLELSHDAHKRLMDYCKKKKIMFLSSPFDLESIDFLNKLGLRMFKIPSGEIVNLPYLEKMGGLNKKIIMSTGMADLKDIGNALEILQNAGTPKGNITVLHCNTEYPSPFEDANLLAMLTIKRRFKVDVGYSDHTVGIEAAIAAAALGACVIEKHFTLDKNMKGPDHKASIEPCEFKSMVVSIRNIEKAMGNGVKRPSASESVNMGIARKSIVAACVIRKGDFFNDKNLIVKRPGTGISPMKFKNIIGMKAKKDFKKDDLIEI